MPPARDGVKEIFGSFYFFWAKERKIGVRNVKVLLRLDLQCLYMYSSRLVCANFILRMKGIVLFLI